MFIDPSIALVFTAPLGAALTFVAEVHIFRS
jgi:hypothetical protein